MRLALQSQPRRFKARAATDESKRRSLPTSPRAPQRQMRPARDHANKKRPARGGNTKSTTGASGRGPRPEPGPATADWRGRRPGALLDAGSGRRQLLNRSSTLLNPSRSVDGQVIGDGRMQMHRDIIRLPPRRPEDVGMCQNARNISANEKILEGQRRASIRQVRTTAKHVEPAANWMATPWDRS